MSDHIDSRPGGLPGTYPSAERLDLIELLHGHRIADPYRWLEDSTDPRTVEWSEQQDELFTAIRQTWAADEDLEFFRTRTIQLADTGLVGPPGLARRAALPSAPRGRTGTQHPADLGGGRDRAPADRPSRHRPERPDHAG